MKKQILEALHTIGLTAAATGMKGELSIHFSGIRPDDFDKILEEVQQDTGLTRLNHVFEVSENLIVKLLLD